MYEFSELLVLCCCNLPELLIIHFLLINNQFSFAPLEGGIGWSRAGPVAIGTMITGLAAAMEPSIVNWLPNSHGGDFLLKKLNQKLNITLIVLESFSTND